MTERERSLQELSAALGMGRRDLLQRWIAVLRLRAEDLGKEYSGMKCQYCGEEIRDGMQFCVHCGHRIEKETKRFCPSCGKEAAAGQLFCGYCGKRLDDLAICVDPIPEPQPEPAPEPEPQPEPKPEPQPVLNGLLLDLSLMAMYRGEPKVVSATQTTGTLKVYRDRLEMKKSLANVGPVGGLVKMASGAKEAHNNQYESWYFRDMRSVHVGRYLGVYHTIVITMKNGTKTTFASTSPAPNKIDNAVSLIDSILKSGRY